MNETDQIEQIVRDIDPEQLLIVHTDGACSGNPGPGGWGIVLSQGGSLIDEYSGGNPHTTNNRMELTAVLETLRRVPANVPLKIMTDSLNVIGWLTKVFKRRDRTIAALCAQIDALLAGRDCQFEKVAGHQGDNFNERADWLARAAIPKSI